MKIMNLFRPAVFLVVILAATVLVALFSGGESSAATLLVTSLSDDANPGTLRNLIAAASAGDTIKFGVTGRINLASGSGSLVITKNLTIAGPGAEVLEISGYDPVTTVAGRVFFINTVALTTISGVTIRDGNAGIGVGGGIDNRGSLKVSEVIFTLNTASIGGGLHSQTETATLLIERSYFFNNNADNGGGAIAKATGDANILDSAFAGNAAYYGGAIAMTNTGLLTIQNTTFHSNNANIAGAITTSSASSTLTLLNCTFSDNYANSPGGTLSIETGSTVNASNTIFANINVTGASNCNVPINGTNSHNLDFGGPVESLNSCGALLTGNPLLGVFNTNGGMTPTRAPQPGSAAIDAGDSAGAPATDQRGWPRPYGAAVDIGAVEVMPSALLEVLRSGLGSIISNPPGLVCTTGCAGASTYFQLNSTVVLSSIPDPGNEIFGGWTGTGCGSSVLMSVNRQCTATFTHCAGNPVKGPLNSYLTITEVYNSAGGGATVPLLVTASRRIEDLILNDNKTLILSGGYDCAFESPVGLTYIDGIISIGGGTVILDRISIL
ncbi:MAG: hypothetical protein C0402_06895 [Thermodesulfovibrio sp.]|nr:hypothetical protein [Thermodesulfovibrio sp.]